MRSSDSSIATCLSRLDSLIQSVGRLQKAHASRCANPSNERAFRKIQLAKAAIEADYKALRAKLNEVRISLSDDEELAKSKRRQKLLERVFPQ